MNNDKADFNVGNICFWIILSGIFLVSAMVYGYLTEHHLMNKFVPLVNITSKIRIEATSAHLWFEEVISGDKSVDMAIVRKKLLLAKKNAKTMLDGGYNDVYGDIIPLTNRFLRSEINKVIQKIEKLITITEKRYKNFKSSGIGSSIDQRYDEVFKDFINQTKNVEGNLISEIERQKTHFRNSHIILISLSIFLLVYIIYITISFHRRNAHYNKTIKKTNEELKKALDEVKILHGIIPICSYCNKIRDKKGLWNQLEVYIHEHSNAEFSHGICPDCYEKQMGEFRQERKKADLILSGKGKAFCK